MLVPQRPSDAAKAKLVKSFLLYAIGAGQQSATMLAYAPLPTALLTQVQSAVNGIQA